MRRREFCKRTSDETTTVKSRCICEDCARIHGVRAGDIILAKAGPGVELPARFKKKVGPTH